MTTKNLRLIAARIIDAVTNGQSLAELLPVALSNIGEPRDRAFVQALCYGVCRFYPRLDITLSHLLAKPMKAKDSDVHALLMVGLYQLMEMQTPPHAAVSETVNAVEALKKPWARGLVNAVLRQYLREEKALPELIAEDEEAQFAHPLWWISAVRKAWPAQWQEILNANNEHPPFSLRVNQQHISADDYLAKLTVQGMPAHRIAHTSHGIILEKPVAAEALPGFAEGDVSVQDGAAQLAAQFLKLAPGLRVLDACAAPGGKLTHLLEIEPSLDVTAVEKDPARLQPVREILQRLKQTAALLTADAADLNAWWDGKKFDRILLDAPCSASGVIRRHPDIKLLRLPTDLREVTMIQTRLLNALWQTLADDGVLVYATCSIFPAENTEIIRKFLDTHADATEEEIAEDIGMPAAPGRQILPGTHEMDGFYYARLRKRPG
jgi:16S rRNA (cytosine967-C5)-methyltransferase